MDSKLIRWRHWSDHPIMTCICDPVWIATFVFHYGLSASWTKLDWKMEMYSFWGMIDRSSMNCDIRISLWSFSNLNKTGLENGNVFILEDIKWMDWLSVAMDIVCLALLKTVMWEYVWRQLLLWHWYWYMYSLYSSQCLNYEQSLKILSFYKIVLCIL